MIQAYEYICSSPYANMATLPCIQTNNAVVDAIVNQKYWKAKSKNICIIPVMNNIPKLPIDDFDFVAILSNLLDNAIEACDLVHSNRVVQLKILYEMDRLIVSVRNPALSPPITVDETLITSKSDSGQHGYGLRSIQRSLNKYDAHYGYDYKDNHFQFSAIIPIPS